MKIKDFLFIIFICVFVELCLFDPSQLPFLLSCLPLLGFISLNENKKDN